MAGIAADTGMDADVISRLLGSGQDLLEIKESDTAAREMGVRAVPTFIVAGQHVVSGAQSVELWHSVIEDIRNQLEVENTDVDQFG